MNLVSAQKGHWLSQRRIISPIFKNHVIEENAILLFRISMCLAKAQRWWRKKPRWRHEVWGLGIHRLHNLFLMT